MITGITTAFIKESDVFGKRSFEYALLRPMKPMYRYS